MKTRTIVVTATLVASSLAFSPLPISAALSHHFTSKGAYAVSEFYDPVTQASGNLQVQRGGPTSAPLTYLVFFSQVCDELGCHGIGGYGSIPNRNFTVVGSKSAALDTNTSENRNMYVFL